MSQCFQAMDYEYAGIGGVGGHLRQDRSHRKQNLEDGRQFSRQSAREMGAY